MARAGRAIAVASVLGTVALAVLAPFAAGASAAAPRHVAVVRARPPHVIPPAFPPYTAHNSGTPNSTIKLFNSDGQLIAYGNSSVMYYLPQFLQGLPPGQEKTPRALFVQGESLYAINCSGCHGVVANGVPPHYTPPGGFPSLQHVGPATIDFWIESGRMPATSTKLTQPVRRAARLDHLEAIEIATYLNTRWPATPYIPVVNLQGASLSSGAALFSLELRGVPHDHR